MYYIIVIFVNNIIVYVFKYLNKLSIKLIIYCFRNYLELANWATWEKLSAIVTLGMIHRGHETNAIELMRCYLSSKNDSSGYYECGSLYALGLIHGNHGVAINDYILGYLKNTQLQVNYIHSKIFKKYNCLYFTLFS